MPELPDVEGFRRKFQRLARGRTVASVEIEARGRMKDRRRLFRVTRKALGRALRRPGDYDALPRSWLIHHRRAGGECPRCEARLSRATVAGRTTFWCPDEQREGRRSG